MLPVKVFLTTLLLFGSALALPEARESHDVDVRDAAPEPEPVNLAKRSCKCSKVKNAGLYCGYCYLSNINNFAVISGWVDDHVYWCNTAGGCDDLGKRTSCGQEKGPC